MPAPPGRLRSRRDFDRVFAQKWRRGASRLVLAAARRGDGGPARVGWVISSRVGGAVERNRLRRRLRAIVVDLHEGLPDGLDLVFTARPGAAQASFAELSEQLSDLVGRARRELFGPVV